MPTFKNPNSLFKYVERNIPFILNQIAKEVETILKDYIMQNLYQAYTPKEYARTYDFVNSVTVGTVKKINNGYSIEIYYDTDKIRQAIVQDSDWNQHMSVDGSETWNGVKINELIPYFIEHGTEGSKWDRDGLFAMENTVKQLEMTKYHVSKMMELLKKRGFNVTIK